LRFSHENTKATQIGLRGLMFVSTLEHVAVEMIVTKVQGFVPRSAPKALDLGQTTSLPPQGATTLTANGFVAVMGGFELSITFTVNSK
jgi:hypothetical protein